MNKVIENLFEKKKEQETQLKILQKEMSSIEQMLFEEMTKETKLYESVVKNNMADIISIIQKNGLEFTNYRTDNVVSIEVSRNSYKAHIFIKDGTVVTDLTTSDVYNNDGYSKDILSRTQIMVNSDIIPYCEKNKLKYDKNNIDN